jgi:hypothetical protein
MPNEQMDNIEHMNAGKKKTKKEANRTSYSAHFHMALEKSRRLEKKRKQFRHHLP